MLLCKEVNILESKYSSCSVHSPHLVISFPSRPKKNTRGSLRIGSEGLPLYCMYSVGDTELSALRSALSACAGLSVRVKKPECQASDN